MNCAMSDHTRRLAVRFAFATVLFVSVATSLAAMTRYRDAMLITVKQHHSLTSKLGQMRRFIAEEREVLARFKRILPSDFGARSPQLLMYSRLDEIKSRLGAPDMSVNTIQINDSERIIHFSLKIPNPDYSQVLNKLAALETEAFPFVSISSIEISNKASDASAGLTINIEGDVIMPNVATTESSAEQGQPRQAGAGTGAARP